MKTSFIADETSVFKEILITIFTITTEIFLSPVLCLAPCKKLSICACALMCLMLNIVTIVYTQDILKLCLPSERHQLHPSCLFSLHVNGKNGAAVL